MNRPTCETCPFWKIAAHRQPVQTSPTTSVALGECHIRSGTFWPIMRADDWCGEHPQFRDWMRKAEVARCGALYAGARCKLLLGHDGRHDYEGLVDLASQPDR